MLYLKKSQIKLNFPIGNLRVNKTYIDIYIIWLLFILSKCFVKYRYNYFLSRKTDLVLVKLENKIGKCEKINLLSFIKFKIN